MPLLTIISNKKFSSIEKQEIIKVTTDSVIEKWNVLPDKIQVHISIGLSLGDKTSLVNQLTQYFATKYKISGDNIVIYIRELPLKIGFKMESVEEIQNS